MKNGCPSSSTARTSPARSRATTWSGPFSSRDAALQTYSNQVPANLEILPGPTADGASGTTTFYVVHRDAAVSGTDLRDARASVDDFNRPAVAFTLTPAFTLSTCASRAFTNCVLNPSVLGGTDLDCPLSRVHNKEVQ